MVKACKPLGRWVFRLLALGTVAGVLWIALLAYPQLLLTQEIQAGSAVLHFRGEADADVQVVAKRTGHRLQAGGFGSPNNPSHIFLFRSHGLYGFFARLVGVPPEAQGFALAPLGNAFVNGPRVEALGNRAGRSPSYSIWEGDISHTAAHEAAHMILMDSIGRRRWKALPHWKQEGIPEYMASIGLIRADTTTSLERRIGILLNDREWLGPRSWDRIHFEAGLLVEFLMEVQSQGLQEVMDGRITREETLATMLKWRDGRSSRASRESHPTYPDPTGG